MTIGRPRPLWWCAWPVGYDPLVLLPSQTIARRFALWTVVCTVTAAPSFLWAHSAFSRPAMVCGVALFICLYTIWTCNAAFERFHARPFVRRTLYIGYLTRMALSVAFPLGMLLDIYPGLVSIALVERARIPPHGFLGTFLITCVQGTLLNILLAVFMGIVYAVQRACCTPPAQQVRGGFPVIVRDPPSG